MGGLGWFSEVTDNFTVAAAATVTQVQFWGGYVQQGVLTVSVRDCAAMLDFTQGVDPGPPYAAPPPS